MAYYGVGLFFEIESQAHLVAAFRGLKLFDVALQKKNENIESVEIHMFFFDQRA
ncbi:hypothetical protein JCM19232_4707 [Vibrio ishigakensis]|uniref:Uncharacterized protein n=1 Tax=Vibrio ishigakensis TaxID=1481914 RepID=A0A0B8P857_9VIBR|nr:hypothetical protein JCM19232_4707 [Vibrio ishigakensis]